MKYALIFIVAAARLLPHPGNFTPIGALGLFAGAYLHDRRVWAVPLAALLLGDVFIGFYDPVVMAFVYVGFALSAVIGRILLRHKRTPVRIGAAVLASASVFFIVSNFGCWATGMYPHTLDGLVRCYVAALPFFGNTLSGDVFYAALLFGVAEAAAAWRLGRTAAHAG